MDLILKLKHRWPYCILDCTDHFIENSLEFNLREIKILSSNNVSADLW